MAHDQPGRLSGVLERAQNMQGLPQTGEMLLGQIQQKAGDRAMYGRMHWNSGRVWEDKQWETHLRWRKETIERSFAEAKELHGLRYARMLGIRNMYEQSFLTAAVQNMKRIARAFRSLFSVLPYAFRGCFQKNSRLCRRSEFLRPWAQTFLKLLAEKAAAGGLLRQAEKPLSSFSGQRLCLFSAHAAPARHGMLLPPGA